MQDAASRGGVSASRLLTTNFTGHAEGVPGHLGHMAIAFISPRASLLFGFLASPQTVAELCERVEELSRLDAALVTEITTLAAEHANVLLGTSSPLMTLRHLSDSGEEGVLRELERLQAHELVDCTGADTWADGELPALWFRRDCA
jgi:hypothetical protein